MHTMQLLKRSEQYQRQVYRADEERRQALATSEALTALWQKKFEKAEVLIAYTMFCYDSAMLSYMYTDSTA